MRRCGGLHGYRFVCAAAVIFLSAAASRGSIIQFFGSDPDADSWRNPAVAKPLDLSGDNVYGTDGYVAFGTSPASTSTGVTNTSVNPFTYTNGSRSTLLSSPAYVSSFVPNANFSSVSSGFSFPNVNDPRVAGGGSTIESGLASRPGVLLSFAPLFTFTVNSSVPKSFEVGLFFNEALSVAPTWQISSNLGGSATAGGLLSVSPHFNALFFTVANPTAGEVFTISGEATLGVSNLDFAAITFDTVVPEPATLGTCATVLIGIIWISRRKSAVLLKNQLT
jgi:hypothetical protein